MGEKVITDQEGSDCLDISAARLEALVAARAVLADAIRSGSDDHPETSVIADSEGRELATVPFAVVLPFEALGRSIEAGQIPTSESRGPVRIHVRIASRRCPMEKEPR